MEQHYTFVEQRTLHDAELKKGGARVNDLGRLVVTQAQIDILQVHQTVYELNLAPNSDTMIDVLCERDVPEVNTPELDAWFNVSTSDLLTATTIGYETTRRRAASALNRGGIDTVRNILIAGRKNLRYLRNFGPACLDVTETALASNSFGIRLKDNPTKTDLVSLCTQLEYVCVGAAIDLDHEFRGLNLKHVQASTALQIAQVSINKINSIDLWTKTEKRIECDRIIATAESLKLAVDRYVSRVYS